MDDMLNRILECIGTKHGEAKKLADHLGISPNVITNWKNGSNKSYRKYVKEIAEYFGCSIKYLETGERTPLDVYMYGNPEAPINRVSSDKITFDDFTYAMYNHSADLTDEEKKMLLEMAEFMKKKRGL